MIAYDGVEVEAGVAGRSGSREVVVCMVEVAVALACWVQVPVAGMPS